MRGEEILRISREAVSHRGGGIRPVAILKKAYNVKLTQSAENKYHRPYLQN